MKIEVTVALTPHRLAEAFCDLSDEEQAQFFIECAEIAETQWDHHAGMQWSAIGGHLRTCECSTYEARQMVEDIASATRKAPAPI
jgi:hypothetical protein